MTAGSALRELGGVLDDIEQTAAVRHVELVEVTVEPGAGALTAEVELTVSTEPTDTAAHADTETGGDPDTDASAGVGATALRPGTTVDADGRLRLTFETVDPLVPAADGVTIEPVAVSLAGDGRLAVTLSVAVSTDRDPGTDATRGTTRRGEAVPGHGDARADLDTTDERRETQAATDADATDEGVEGDRSGRRGEGEAVGHRSVRSDRSVPPFRDTELLAEVYDTHETFAEMAVALDMDVTAETVRRYMIDAGVHQPASYNTGGTDTTDDDAPDAEDPTTDPDRDRSTDGPEPSDSADADTDADGSPVVLADGIGLPNDITVETLVEAVKRSNTVHEVERAVGVDHDDALELLRELNLLDLVVGRLATEAERDISRAEVVERLREASATR
jgi:hypothetical protein